MSQQNNRRYEWIGVITGGFTAIILISLTNILPIFASYAYIFAVINIFLFLCSLFSIFFITFFLSLNRRPPTILLLIHILSAILIGFIIVYIDSGKNYYSGATIIPQNFSWSTVAGISITLIIPLINLLASFPIAIWLGSLIYYKIYSTSYFSKTVIGSPLFTAPLFVFLGYYISEKLNSLQNMVYIFDKREGTMRQQRLPKARIPIRRLLTTIIVFLMFSSMLTAAFGYWNEIEETDIRFLSDPQLSSHIFYDDPYSFYLKVAFSLVNVRGKTVPAEGILELILFDGNGTLIYNNQFRFSQNDFTLKAKDYWVCTCYIPSQSLSSYVISKTRSVTMLPHLVKIINSGYAIFKVYLNNGKKTLIAIASTEYLSNINFLIKLYFQKEVETMQAELNKQWSIKVRINNYFKLGSYGWIVVERNKREISLYPGRIYDWYILQSTDGGWRWNIMWKDDNPPTFRIEFLSEKEVRVTTPYGIFITKNEGKTWEKINQ